MLSATWVLLAVNLDFRFDSFRLHLVSYMGVSSGTRYRCSGCVRAFQEEAFSKEWFHRAEENPQVLY